MADIALLVAEEYERRTKSSIKGSGGEDISLVSCVYQVAKSKSVDGLCWVKEVGKEKLQFAAKGAVDPKSSFVLAVLNGFISA